MGLHRNSSDFHPSHTGRRGRPMAFICKLREHAPPGEKLRGGGAWRRGAADEWNAMWGDGADPTPFIPYLGCCSLHIDRRVDWGLRLAATFSQKASEIQYWEWMATSCCQCCNLGNRQGTILVPPLATGMAGKTTSWIFTANGQDYTQTHAFTIRHTQARACIYKTGLHAVTKNHVTHLIRPLIRIYACIYILGTSANLARHKENDRQWQFSLEHASEIHSWTSHSHNCSLVSCLHMQQLLYQLLSAMVTSPLMAMSIPKQPNWNIKT